MIERRVPGSTARSVNGDNEGALLTARFATPNGPPVLEANVHAR